MGCGTLNSSSDTPLIKHFSNTSLNNLVPVFQHLTQVAATQAHQSVNDRLNGQKILWIEHDMHEQYVEPAMKSVQEVIKELQDNSDVLKKPLGLRIIVGKGNGRRRSHSQDQECIPQNSFMTIKSNASIAIFTTMA